MKCAALLLLLLACLLPQGECNIPNKEDLCGLIVDSVLEEKCLYCFTKAGDISEHPEKVRECVGKYLPPDVAECSVLHPDHRLAGTPTERAAKGKGPSRTKVRQSTTTNDTGTGRIQHGPSDLHHNHTNANLLPNCLLRRMRAMSRYLQRENRFTQEAGRTVKAVVLSKLVRGGGPAMLAIGAQNAILAIPEVQAIVNTHASSCLTEFNEESVRSERLEIISSDQEDDDYDLEALFRYDDYDQEDDDYDLEALFRYDDYDLEDDDYMEVQRGRVSPPGNNLPFGGTNSLARHILLGQCIIKTLVENGAGLDLLKILQDDEFFYPIPGWWVEPMLNLYKVLSEGSN